MADIFISYSSQDRVIAQRFEAALGEAGYAVFRDQSTPAGQDWDSWIRGQLASARLTLVLWSKASVASPNVRHEAIIARESGKLMPVMIDDLAPTDFPMGLFMVHALKIGRSEREFDAALPRFLEDVAGRLQTAPRVKKKRLISRRVRRWAVSFGVAVVLVLLAVRFVPWASIGYLLSPETPPVTRQQMRAAAITEAPVRARLAAAAARAPGWHVAEFVAAAPDESREANPAGLAALDGAVRGGCNCYAWDGAPDSSGNAWTLIAMVRAGRPVAPALFDTILSAQNEDGWWPPRFDAAPVDENASLPATALMTIALAEARRAGSVPQPARARVDVALGKAAAWLDRGPPRGWLWSDFAGSDRRTQSNVFAAMAAVAGRIAGGPADGGAVKAFLASMDSLPPATARFDASVPIALRGGGRATDDASYAISPWIGAAAAFAYPQADAAQKRRLRSILDHWLTVDLGDPALARQDWITAETLVLRGIAFRRLAEARRRPR